MAMFEHELWYANEFKVVDEMSLVEMPCCPSSGMSGQVCKRLKSATTINITAFSITTFSIMTFSITEFSITAFSIIAFSIMTFNKTTFSITTFSITLKTI